MPDAEPDAPAPPKPPHGCWLFAGLVLSGTLGFAGAVVAMALNAPFGVVAGVMFGTPGLYIVALCALSIRHTRKYGLGPDVTPEARAAAPILTPYIVAFLMVGAVSIAGVIAAQVLGAPAWVTPVAVVTPPVMFVAFAWRHLQSLAERIKRAAPSPEKAAAVARKAARAAPQIVAADAAEFPTVPTVETAPGRRLAHRLPDAGVSAGCACLGVLAAAAFWNGIVSVFVWQAVRGFQKGNPEWFLVVFLIPFVLIGAFLAFAAVFAAGLWAVSMMAGKVAVEVDAHPFVPGGQYRGHVTQTGPFRLTIIRVELVCTESATYQSGTTESTDAKEVVRHPGELPERFAAAPVDFGLAVPDDAMHSFAAPKNRVNWTIKVSGWLLGRLRYTQSFAAVVRPGAEHG